MPKVEYVIINLEDEHEIVCLRVQHGEREAIYSGIHDGRRDMMDEIIDMAMLQAEVDYSAGHLGLPWIAPLTEDEWWILRTGTLVEAAA